MIWDKNTWQNVFATIVQDLIFLEDREALFATLGFSPDQWPSCPAKTMWLNFEELKGKHGRAMAVHKLEEKAEQLTQRPFPLPEDNRSLQALHDEALQYARGVELAKDLAKAPHMALDIVDQFRLKASRAVKVMNLAEGIREALDTHLKEVEEGKTVITIPRWEKLSELISGFNPGRVILIVADTGVGKTTLTLNLAIDATQVGPVLFFNMEMPNKDIISRILCSQSSMRFKDWQKGWLDYDKIGQFVDTLDKRSGFFYTDGRALTLTQIISTISLYKQRHGIQFVIVDYDQKIRMSGNDEEWRQLLRAIEELEEVAKALEVNVILLAQGNDRGDPKASKRSKQPATAVLNFHKRDDDFHYLEPKKNRFGELDKVLKIAFVGAQAKMTELELMDKKKLEKQQQEGFSL